MRAIPSCGTRWVPRGSRGLILGSTGRGRPLLYPASVFPTIDTEFREGREKEMDPLGKCQDGKEEELTAPVALIKDNRKGKMRLLELCVMFTCVSFVT